MTDRLRGVWNFDDLDGTAARFHEQFEHEESDSGRAEVLSQLARVEGLRGEFDRCAELLDKAELLAGSDPVANVRLELERGRMFRSSGDLEAAFPLFRSAFERACKAGDYWFAGDAAHMCAIAVTDRDLMEEWTQRGLDLGEREPEAAYWAGPLLNNLGWAYFDAGEHERALELFEQALVVRERDSSNSAAIQFAKEAIEEARQALAR
jgi:tetratricopeptide (TPR) repeat protein